MAQSMETLSLPPLPTLLAQATVLHVRDPLVFQIQHRRDGKVDPCLDSAEVDEAVLRKTQCRFDLLKEQLDVPVILPP